MAFEPNLVHSIKYQIQKDIPMDQAAEDAAWVVGDMFGTPDEPTLPKVVVDDEDLASVVKIERLTRASGHEKAEGRGLFRKHCAVCHGVSGNGRGPTAAVQVPYPRDYRMGVFKFKSTPRGEKPTREDMAKLIRGGIDGTAMKPIPGLTEDDIQALVDYVIYLSWRGEVERNLVDDAMFELDLEGGDRILNHQFASSLTPELAEKLETINEDVDGEDLQAYETYLAMSERLKTDSGLHERLTAAAESGDEALASDVEAFELYQEVSEDLSDDAELQATYEKTLQQTSGQQLRDFELYSESWEIAEDFAADVGESWLDASDEVLEVPEPPEDLPLAESYDDVVAFSEGPQAEAFAASVKRGQELFVGKVASCSKCHGEKGRGNGQTTDYDEWTKDWTSRVGLKPENHDSLVPLLARGALPPRNALPRNFAQGVFRGGSSSADLYRRMTQGIDGTPMPAVTFVEGQFEQDDIWNLINFIRSLEVPEPASPVAPVVEQAS
ncbi:MAG: cytochrome c [Rubripirellula sp.]